MRVFGRNAQRLAISTLASSASGRSANSSRHFEPRLEAVLGRELAPVGLGHQPALGDAHQRVVRLVVLARREKRLVGGDDGKSGPVGEIEQRGLDGPLALEPVALDFDIEPAIEDRLELAEPRPRELRLFGREHAVDRAVRPAGERDQAVGVRRQPVGRHVRRRLGLDLEEALRHQRHEIPVAVLAGGEQHDARQAMHARAVVARGLVAEHDRERAADDRLDAGPGQLFRKLQCSKEVTGVGERQRRLPVGRRQLREPRDRQRALQQRIGRMDVQMDEAGIGQGGLRFSQAVWWAL